MSKKKEMSKKDEDGVGGKGTSLKKKKVYNQNICSFLCCTSIKRNV